MQWEQSSSTIGYNIFLQLGGVRLQWEGLTIRIILLFTCQKRLLEVQWGDPITYIIMMLTTLPMIYQVMLSLIDPLYLLSLQLTFHFSLLPTFSFEFTFVTSVTVLGFQFNLYLSEYLNTYAALILGSSLSKKRDL
jgi:hypothetical protein